MGPGDRQKCGSCAKKVAFEETYAITDDRPFCSLKCYMKYIRTAQPQRYEQLAIVLGEF